MIFLTTSDTNRAVTELDELLKIFYQNKRSLSLDKKITIREPSSQQSSVTFYCGCLYQKWLEHGRP